MLRSYYVDILSCNMATEKFIQKDLSESELGKSFASLNWEGAV